MLITAIALIVNELRAYRARRAEQQIINPLPGFLADSGPGWRPGRGFPGARYGIDPAYWQSCSKREL
jgi:hypothetical protein